MDIVLDFMYTIGTIGILILISCDAFVVLPQLPFELLVPRFGADPEIAAFAPQPATLVRSGRQQIDGTCLAPYLAGRVSSLTCRLFRDVPGTYTAAGSR